MVSSLEEESQFIREKMLVRSSHRMTGRNIRGLVQLPGVLTRISLVRSVSPDNGNQAERYAVPWARHAFSFAHEKQEEISRYFLSAVSSIKVMNHNMIPFQTTGTMMLIERICWAYSLINREIYVFLPSNSAWCTERNQIWPAVYGVQYRAI